MKQTNRVILAVLRLNRNLQADGVHLNLSCNDLGSQVRLFMNELSEHTCLTNLDLSENCTHILFLLTCVAYTTK